MLQDRGAVADATPLNEVVTTMGKHGAAPQPPTPGPHPGPQPPEPLPLPEPLPNPPPTNPIPPPEPVVLLGATNATRSGKTLR
jgi:hypothetical protein